MARTPRRWEPLLLLDYDTRAEYRDFPVRARFLARWLDLPLTGFRIRRRRSSRGWHVVVYIRSMPEVAAAFPPLAIVCAQAILGSDWKREGFNLVRAMYLSAAPVSWQQIGRWNTLYLRKMGAFDNGIGKPAPFPDGDSVLIKQHEE